MGNAVRNIWKSPFLIFTVLLLIKLILLRSFLYEAISLKGLGFDLAFILLLVCLIELLVPKGWINSFYWTISIVLSILFFTISVYFHYFGSVIIYTSLFQIKQAGHVSDSIKSIIKLQDFLFFADMLIGLIFYILSRKLTKLRLSFLKPLPIKKLTWIILGVVCLAFSFTAYKLDKTYTNELVRADELGILNYEINTYLLRDKTSFTNMSQATNAIAESQFITETTPESVKPPKQFASQKGKNLIVIQLEAFQNFPIDLKIDGVEVTPVLNSLAKDGYYFSNVFQQIGQGNTSDAEFLSNTSLYPTGSIAMSTGYGDRDIPSLPKLLKEQGYIADTFHVNDVSFWERNKLYPALGFSNYYDKPFYKNDNFNSLGASDEEMYRVGLEKITAIHQQNKLFYAQFVTLSSHHPFKVPAAQQNNALRDTLTKSQLGDYLLSVNYTDSALGKFIEGLKGAGLWDNTILVIYGDHFGLQPKDNTPEAIYEAIKVKYHPTISRFNIPLLIHVPDLPVGERITNVGGQIDIMPTVANLMGISLKDKAFVHFGQDLLNTTNNRFGMRYYMPTGSFFNNEIMFVPGKGFEDGKATSLTTLEPIADFSQYRDDYNYVLNQMRLSDEYLNMLPKR